MQAALKELLSSAAPAGTTVPSCLYVHTNWVTRRLLIRARHFVQDRHEVSTPGTPGHPLPHRPRPASGGAEHNQTVGDGPGAGAKPEPDEPAEPDMPGQWCAPGDAFGAGFPGDAFGVDGLVGVELPLVAALASAAPPPASAPVTISAAASLLSLICIGLLS
jgi:hypothetical protein